MSRVSKCCSYDGLGLMEKWFLPDLTAACIKRRGSAGRCFISEMQMREFGLIAFIIVVMETSPVLTSYHYDSLAHKGHPLWLFQQ